MNTHFREARLIPQSNQLALHRNQYILHLIRHSLDLQLKVDHSPVPDRYIRYQRLVAQHYFHCHLMVFRYNNRFLPQYHTLKIFRLSHYMCQLPLDISQVAIQYNLLQW